MARQRFIWPDLWTDPQVARLPPDAMLLFIGCFSNADDDGRILGDPAYLKATVFPYQKFDTTYVAELRRTMLEACDTIELYVVQDVEYMVFHRWTDYQKPKYPKPSKLPPPPKTSGRKSARSLTSSQKPSGNDSGNTSPESTEPLREPSGNDSVTGLDRTGMGLLTNSRSEVRDELPVHQYSLLAELMQWVGPDADSRTGAVIRANLEPLTEAQVASVRQSMKTARPRHRARWLVGTLKAVIRDAA